MISAAILVVATVALQSAPSSQAPASPARDEPLMDPFHTSQALVAIAVEQGTMREFQPIPLDHDGGTTHGVVFDQFRLVARAARAAATAGTRLDGGSLPADITRPSSVVLAYPLSCDGRSIAPVAIEIVDAQGAAVRRDGDYIRDGAIGTFLPGVQAPVSSLAAAFTIQTLRPEDAIRITYSDASCTSGASALVLPIRFTAARTLEAPTPPLPAGLPRSDTPVRLQALVDLDGRLQRAVYVDGPAYLTRAALDAIQRWRSEPPRINGAPIVRAVLVQVAFKP